MYRLYGTKAYVERAKTMFSGECGLQVRMDCHRNDRLY